MHKGYFQFGSDRYVIDCFADCPFLMMVWAIENHSKEKAERMTYLDIHIYKKALRGLSICFGLTYITILVILLLIAYHLIIAEL